MGEKIEGQPGANLPKTQKALDIRERIDTAWRGKKATLAEKEKFGQGVEVEGSKEGTGLFGKLQDLKSETAKLTPFQEMSSRFHKVSEKLSEKATVKQEPSEASSEETTSEVQPSTTDEANIRPSQAETQPKKPLFQPRDKPLAQGELEPKKPLIQPGDKPLTQVGIEPKKPLAQPGDKPSAQGEMEPKKPVIQAGDKPLTQGVIEPKKPLAQAGDKPSAQGEIEAKKPVIQPGDKPLTQDGMEPKKAVIQPGDKPSAQGEMEPKKPLIQPGDKPLAQGEMEPKKPVIQPGDKPLTQGGMEPKKPLIQPGDKPLAQGEMQAKKAVIQPENKALPQAKTQPKKPVIQPGDKPLTQDGMEPKKSLIQPSIQSVIQPGQSSLKEVTKTVPTKDEEAKKKPESVSLPQGLQVSQGPFGQTVTVEASSKAAPARDVEQMSQLYSSMLTDIKVSDPILNPKNAVLMTFSAENPNLKDVQAMITKEGDFVTIKFDTRNPAAESYIRQNLDTLTANFNKAGFKIKEIDIGNTKIDIAIPPTTPKIEPNATPSVDTQQHGEQPEGKSRGEYIKEEEEETPKKE